MDETLAYINRKLKGSFVFDVKNGNLYLDSYYEGIKVKDEIVLITDLIPEVIYSEEEKAIILKCAGGEKCVKRHEYQVKKKNYFSRIKIVTPDDEKSVKGLQNAFLHLIKMLYYPKYKSTEPFE